MSIEVPIEQLAATLVEFPWAFLVTRSDDAAHVLSVQPSWGHNALVMSVGRSAAANVAVRPEVTLAFAPADGRDMSLLVDGLGSVDGDSLRVVPLRAVRHRPALR
jgi:hypothetical protein